MFGLKNTSNCISAVFLALSCSVRVRGSVVLVSGCRCQMLLISSKYFKRERATSANRMMWSGGGGAAATRHPQRLHYYWCINAKWRAPFSTISNGHSGIRIRFKCAAPIHSTYALSIALCLCIYVSESHSVWHVSGSEAMRMCVLFCTAEQKNANIWISTCIQHTNETYTFSLCF